MSLVSNIQNVSFTTRWPTDKIVGVWEGSYDRTTDVVSRSYTFLGLPYTVYFKRIPHGFTRPIFCDLLWSIDNISFADGGAGSISGESSIAFSDSTYIYIYDSQGAAAVGTAYYKVIGLWIDSYDGTNPLVPNFVSPNKTILFDTRENYQKVYLRDSLTFTASSTQTISHDLGRRPNFRVFFESYPGEVWPLHSGGASNIYFFSDDQTECRAVMGNASLSVQMQYSGSAASGNRKVWPRIYLDQ